MKEFKLVGVYVNDKKDIEFVFNEFARNECSITNFNVGKINDNSFLTFNKEVFTFITVDTKVANNKFDAVFIDDTIDENIIETIIKPTLKINGKVVKYSIEASKKCMKKESVEDNEV